MESSERPTDSTGQQLNRARAPAGNTGLEPDKPLGHYEGGSLGQAVPFKSGHEHEADRWPTGVNIGPSTNPAKGE